MLEVIRESSIGSVSSEEAYLDELECNKRYVGEHIPRPRGPYPACPPFVDGACKCRAGIVWQMLSPLVICDVCGQKWKKPDLEEAMSATACITVTDDTLISVHNDPGFPDVLTVKFDGHHEVKFIEDSAVSLLALLKARYERGQLGPSNCQQDVTV